MAFPSLPRWLISLTALCVLSGASVVGAETRVDTKFVHKTFSNTTRVLYEGGYIIQVEYFPPDGATYLASRRHDHEMIAYGVWSVSEDKHDGPLMCFDYAYGSE